LPVPHALFAGNRWLYHSVEEYTRCFEWRR